MMVDLCEIKSPTAEERKSNVEFKSSIFLGRHWRRVGDPIVGVGVK